LQGRPRGVFLLSPRYRHCIEEIGGHLGIQSFSDSPLRRGLKAVKIWFADVAITSRTLIERSAVNSTVQPVPRLQQ
ncbi:MAG: hypothetical protein ACAH88_03595, partial [Roseimicrobium sp.]